MSVIKKGFVLGFITFLIVIAVSPLETETLEKRKLAEFPTWNWENPWAYGFGLVKFLEDRFAFKNNLVRTNGILKSQVLGVSPNILYGTLGSDDWMFYTVPYYMESVRHKLSDEELAKITRNMTLVKNWYAQKGIVYEYFFIPVKPHVYPEKLKPLYSHLFSNSNLNNLIEFQDSLNYSTFFHCQKELLEAKKERQIYFKHDTHWNQEGAYTGYKKLMNHLAQIDTQLVMVTDSMIYRKSYVADNGDIPSLFGIGELISSTADSIKFYQPCETNAREFDKTIYYRTPCALNQTKILFVRDSFMGSMAPLINKTFQSNTFHWNLTVPYAVVKEAAPDIIVHEMLERFLFTLEDLPEHIKNDTVFLKQQGVL